MNKNTKINNIIIRKTLHTKVNFEQHVPPKNGSYLFSILWLIYFEPWVLKVYILLSLFYFSTTGFDITLSTKQNKTNKTNKKKQQTNKQTNKQNNC